MHVNASYSPDYLQELKEMKRAEPELFPNTIKILESFNWEEGETNLQLSCPKCQEAQSLWEEQREKQAIEREVGLVERLLAEKGGEREDDLRIIGSLFAKQHMMTRGGLYGKVVKCLAETMHWTQEEMRILTQAFQAENERYYQMKEEGLDPFEEIKPFMQSFDPGYYKSLWGVSCQTRPELRQSEKAKSNDESSVNDSELEREKFKLVEFKEFTLEEFKDILADLEYIEMEDLKD